MFVSVSCVCVPVGCSSGGLGGGSLLEHLFPGFDGQAGVCCFSRSHRGGSQRGEAERMRHRSLQKLERKGGRRAGGKSLRQGRGECVQLTGSQSEGRRRRERRVGAILFDVGREHPTCGDPLIRKHRAETAQHEPITVATKQLMNTKLKGNLRLICGYRCMCVFLYHYKISQLNASPLFPFKCI